MKPISNIIALVLVVLGIVFMSYAGFTYTTEEKVAEIGPVKITNEEKKTVPFSPIAGGVCLVLGVLIFIVNKRKL